MDIEEILVYPRPNIYSLKKPVVRVKVRLGELADVPTKDIRGLNEMLIKMFPGLREHKCSTGYAGGFADRLKEGTYLAHVMEHLCLEVQRMLGFDLKFGKTRNIREDIYNVIYECPDTEIGRACGIFTFEILKGLIEGNVTGVQKEFNELKSFCKKYEHKPEINSIIEEIEKRGIPVWISGDNSCINLGYGKYQKCIAGLQDKNTPGMIDETFVNKMILENDTGKVAPADIIDKLYPKGKQFTVPIISITGTNGKTTTTRMIGSILRQNGYIVGMTTTHGIYINGKCIEKGDTTGPQSAGRVLKDRNIDIAVLETARGGIVRKGLAYDKADIAVFTNLTEDHLGIDDINSMEDLLHAKSLVVEAVKQDGFCILNADDPWVMKSREKVKGTIILYSMNYNNQAILDQLKAGGNAVYLKEEGIYITGGGFCREIIRVSEIPATLEGALKHNIYNSMAAVGACFATGVSFEVIRQALSTFSCDASVNPGRFNIYELGGFKIVLDYGHNLEGYRVTIEGLKNLKPSRLVGIIGVPGDRRDEDILKLGELSGASFDRLIIKEDNDLRGRNPLEVARILYKGALNAGAVKENIQIIPEEEAALQTAILQVEEGDVIVVFFEKMEPLVDLISNYKQAAAFKPEIEEVTALA